MANHQHAKFNLYHSAIGDLTPYIRKYALKDVAQKRIELSLHLVFQSILSSFRVY